MTKGSSQKGLVLVPVLLFSLLVYSSVGILSLLLKHDSQRLHHRFWFYRLDLALRSTLRYSHLFFDAIPLTQSTQSTWFFESQDLGIKVDWFDPPVYLFKTDSYIYATTRHQAYKSILRQAYTIEEQTLILHYIDTLKN